LNIQFGRLYNICDQQFLEVSRVFREGEINLTFRQNFNTSEVGEWEEMESELEGVQLTKEEDIIRWMLTPHRQFTTSPLYKFCTFPEVKNKKMWQSQMPLKMNFFCLVGTKK
jgi:hypothetical protein